MTARKALHVKNWIRKEKRQAIYGRDGYACVYCGTRKRLSLDHIKPRSKGGSNEASNLLTACCRCNIERGTCSLTKFVGPETARALRRQARRVLPT